jgi:hypothetical protein
MAINIRVLASRAMAPCIQVGNNIILTILSPSLGLLNKLASITQKTMKLRVKSLECGRWA